VQETIAFEIGAKSQAEQRGTVSIAGRNLDAQQALRSFDTSKGLLYDASAPQQMFPDDAMPARWLIPIGHVRWLAAQSGLGHFIQPTALDDKETRKFRRYVGVVTETITAADRALVLRNRFDDPNGPNRFAHLLASNDPDVVLDDLVWVEGNLRAVGNVRIAGGGVDWRDADGRDNGAPLRIERDGDTGAAPGGRTLRALIGPDGQTDNRFAVATSKNTGPDEKLTVLSGGNVGIGYNAPTRRLHVRGDRVRLETADGTKRLDLRVDGGSVDLHSETSTLYIRSSGPPPNNNNVVINPVQGDGRVGIGTEAPAYDLDVKAAGIKLGLEDNGGGQLVLLNNPNDNKIFLEGFDAAGTGTAAEMLLTGRFGVNLPRLTFSAETTVAANRLGVGVQAPAERLEVQGNVKFGNALNLFAVGAFTSLRLIVGRIAANGNRIGGSGFTSARTALGRYRVDFDNAFPGFPIVIACPINSLNNDNLVTVRDITAASFNIATTDVKTTIGSDNDTPEDQDTEFTFIAVGAP
jgi:hypothetical protein